MSIKKSFPILGALVVASFSLVTPCGAQQDPEAAERQAEIDASEAQVGIERAERRVISAETVDGVDSVEVPAQEEIINREGQIQQDAYAREEQAESEE